MTSKSIVYEIIKYELNTAVVQGTIIHEFPCLLAWFFFFCLRNGFRAAGCHHFSDMNCV